MATAANERLDPEHWGLSRDVWISEKRSVSQARDPKTARLLPIDERPNGRRLAGIRGLLRKK